jgi:hypothetical protein
MRLATWPGIFFAINRMMHYASREGCYASRADVAWFADGPAQSLRADAAFPRERALSLAALVQ